MPRRVVPMRVISFEDSRNASSSRCSGRISVVFSAIRRLSGVTVTFCALSRSISSRSACRSSTTPLPMIDSLPGRNTPDGSNESLYVIPSITSVWPALWPPWNRTTMSACSDSQSTILPLPSSPHWEPTTTTFAMRNFPHQADGCSYGLDTGRSLGPGYWMTPREARQSNNPPATWCDAKPLQLHGICADLRLYDSWRPWRRNFRSATV